MSDLTDFILVRVTETEETIRAVTNNGKLAFGGPVAEAAGDPWSTTRLLAECKAKRDVVEWALGVEYMREMDGSDVPAKPFEQDVLKAIACVWSDHPDFREEWRA